VGGELLKSFGHEPLGARIDYEVSPIKTRKLKAWSLVGGLIER
jgi:hypothetical protein